MRRQGSPLIDVLKQARQEAHASHARVHRPATLTKMRLAQSTHMHMHCLLTHLRPCCSPCVPSSLNSRRPCCRVRRQAPRNLELPCESNLQYLPDDYDFESGNEGGGSGGSGDDLDARSAFVPSSTSVSLHTPSKMPSHSPLHSSPFAPTSPPPSSTYIRPSSRIEHARAKGRKGSKVETREQSRKKEKKKAREKKTGAREKGEQEEEVYTQENDSHSLDNAGECTTGVATPVTTNASANTTTTTTANAKASRLKSKGAALGRLNSR
jgi:hypothetical protein